MATQTLRYAERIFKLKQPNKKDRTHEVFDLLCMILWFPGDLKCCLAGDSGESAFDSASWSFRGGTGTKAHPFSRGEQIQ